MKFRDIFSNNYNPEMDKEDYGIEVNASMVHNDGTYSVGLHYSDTNGIDISQEGSSDSCPDLLDNIMNGFWKEFIKKSFEAPEKEPEKEDPKNDEKLLAEIKKLQDQIQSLTIDNQILVDREKELHERLNFIKDWCGVLE